MDNINKIKISSNIPSEEAIKNFGNELKRLYFEHIDIHDTVCYDEQAI